MNPPVPKKGKPVSQGHLNAKKYGDCIRLLIEQPLSAHSLEASLQLKYHSILRLLKQLHSQKLVFVFDWERDASGKRSIALYKFTTYPRTNAKRPAQTPKERYQKRKQRTASINVDRALLMLPPITVTTRKPRRNPMLALTNRKNVVELDTTAKECT